MTWAVVAQDAYRDWAETTNEDAHAFIRIAVLEWLIGLQDTGPPENAVVDGSLWLVEVPGTAISARYTVFTGAYPPAIVVREFR